MVVAGMDSSNEETLPIVEPVVQVWMITETKIVSLAHFEKKKKTNKQKNGR